MPSHLSLGSGDSLYSSSSFLSEVFLRCPVFSSSSSSWVFSFGFPSVCSGFSFPLSFCSLWVPGYGAFLFPTTFFPCRVISRGPLSITSLRQFVILLPGVMLSFYFHCDSFWGPLTVFGLVPHLSFVSSSLSGLILLCRISLVFFRVLSSFGCTSIGVFLHLVPPRFTFLVGGWSSSMALLLPGLLPPPLHLTITGAFSLSWPSPSSCGVPVLCPVRFFGCGVVLLVSMTCCSLGFLALSSLGYLGASFPVLPAVSMPFCFLPGLHVFFVRGFRLPLRFSLSFFLARLRA